MGGCGSVEVNGYPVFDERFEVVKRLGSGSFGHVFVGRDVQTGERIAIKIETEKDRSSRAHRMLLEHESDILRSLQVTSVVPKFIWFGKTRKHHTLVSQLLGPSLEDLLELCNPTLAKGQRTFSLTTVLIIGILAVRACKAVHECGYVHRDIKPENMLMGLDSSVKDLYFIDFGLAARIRKNADDKPPGGRTARVGVMKPTGHLVGTPNFASRRAHEGVPASYADDLESLVYTLMYLRRGTLPWANLSRHRLKPQAVHETIKHTKLSVTEFPGFPPNFVKFAEIIIQLTPDMTPDYDGLEQVLTGMLVDETGNGSIAAHPCDWNLLRSQT